MPARIWARHFATACKRHRLELNSVRLRDIRMRVNERHAAVGKKLRFSQGGREKLLERVESDDGVSGAVHDTLLKEQDTAGAQLRDADGLAELLGEKSARLSQVRRRRVVSWADRNLWERDHSGVTSSPLVKRDVLVRPNGHDGDAFAEVGASTHRAWMLQYRHM